ncbi:GGDEF domain-containing protein [Iodobacter fluviatilis]|uniref:diguanylate cyclase n=1 Tax=Iodobacter fluviatilis TaxID=537 RepID=A0A377SU46_9NEIS|nr:GGDEF domain-containing protein [Iodobacter fluviatilis]TCU88050.1 diguanylate cyclase (GGDEF)-like protein [Iodobacter fluviatilis]STR45551.1 Bacteriophytochrome cph2 [Iodobacter fluviatilis]
MSNVTVSTSVNPVEIARIALKKLSERGLAPTPENYTKFYNAIATIKSPDAKTSNETLQAWQLLYKVEDILGDMGETTGQLLSALAGGNEAMTASLDQLQDTRRAHLEQSASPDDTHSKLENLLNSIINSTSEMHSSVTASKTDLLAIRDSVRSIEENLAINRQILEQDALTGAMNRQGFDNRLVREAKLAQRHGHKLSVVLFDLDDFKLVNDRFGHAVGDNVLVHIAGLAKSVLRESDILVRYGGEEFLILLAETDIHGARYVLERLQQVARRNPFMYKQQRLDVTFSTGIAMLRGDENGRALVLRADEALYMAKRNGRGLIELAQ